MKKIIILLVVLLLITSVVFFIFFLKTRKISPKYEDKQLSTEINKCNFPYEAFETTIKTDETLPGNNNESIRHLIIDSSNYCIDNLSKQFQTVKVKGFDSSNMPVIPVSGHTYSVELPNDSEIKEVEIIPNDETRVEELNIPCSNLMCPNCPGCSCTGGYYDCSNDFGIFPEKQDYKIVDHGDSKAILFSLYPVVHNFKTRETSIFKSFSIKIHYKSQKQIMLSSRVDLFAGKNITDKDSAGITITNLSTISHNYKIILTIGDECFSSQPSSGLCINKQITQEEKIENIKSNEEKRIFIDFKAPENFPPTGGGKYVIIKILDEQEKELGSVKDLYLMN